jgi:hypothetical protein
VLSSQILKLAAARIVADKAEAFLNQLAGERSLPIRALSAATVCSRDINPVVREAMAELGCRSNDT